MIQSVAMYFLLKCFRGNKLRPREKLHSFNMYRRLKNGSNIREKEGEDRYTVCVFV